MEIANIQEIELKYTPTKIPDSIKVSNSLEVYQLLKEIWNMDTIELHEEFKVIYLKPNNEIIGIYHHSKGGITGTLADIRLIVGVALKCAATGIIMAHNHPSGNLTASQQDEKLTKRVVQACELFDIKMHEHFIISRDWFSRVE
jgi:DNA repair protein RadC